MWENVQIHAKTCNIWACDGLKSQLWSDLPRQFRKEINTFNNSNVAQNRSFLIYVIIEKGESLRTFVNDSKDNFQKQTIGC